MRIIIIVLTVFISSANCTNSNSRKEVAANLENSFNDSNKSNLEAFPIIKFEKELHDFGLIQQGEKVSYTFKYKNIGTGDLFIKDASASCGCTVPKFSREPLASGESGEIEVIFDTHSRSGNQSKSITIWTNCQPDKIKLRIKAEIPLTR